MISIAKERNHFYYNATSGDNNAVAYVSANNNIATTCGYSLFTHTMNRKTWFCFNHKRLSHCIIRYRLPFILDNENWQ